MNTPLAVIAALCLGVWFAPSAHARTMQDGDARIVSYADLDLSAPSAGAVLNARLRAAAERVCGLDRHRLGLRAAQAARQCYLQNMERARETAAFRGIVLKASSPRMHASQRPDRIEIAFDHLDLGDEGVQAALTMRVERAVRQVCRDAGARGFAVRRAEAGCRQEARAGAYAQLALRMNALTAERSAPSASVVEDLSSNEEAAHQDDASALQQSAVAPLS